MPFASVFTDDAFNCSPLNDGQVKVLIMLATFDPDSALNRPIKAIELRDAMANGSPAPLPVPMQIMADRLQLMTPDVEYTQSAMTFLGSLAETPGDCVMFAYSLYRETKAAGRALTAGDLAMEVIPFGIPNRDILSEWWDKQKLPGGQNGVDTREFWQ